MGKSKQLKFMRKETRKIIREAVEQQRDEAADAIAAARQATIERTRQVLRRKPWFIPRFVWSAMKRCVLQYPLRDNQ